MIRNIARKALQKLGLYSLYSLGKTGPLYEDGWFKSFDSKQSIDLEGRPIPWFTYPAIDFLARRIHPYMSVFEYGCGWGTLWWASRVWRVVACEHDRGWYEEMSKKIPGNAFIYHLDLRYGGEYSSKIAEFKGQFDIVVIDGRDRVNCAINSLQALNAGGVIIWDNSDREEYRRGMDYLCHSGFRSINFSGISPIVNYKTETSIFYRDGNCLGI